MGLVELRYDAPQISIIKFGSGERLAPALTQDLADARPRVSLAPHVVDFAQMDFELVFERRALADGGMCRSSRLRLPVVALKTDGRNEAAEV